jgi:YHS domain-containing protein
MINNSPKVIKLVILITIFSPLFVLDVNTAMANDQVNKTFFGVAIKGYDTVAYHTEGRAVKGKSKFSYNWNDAKWHFASVENRDLFIENPERYAPQYGGY